jgi:hypothetical protein
MGDGWARSIVSVRLGPQLTTAAAMSAELGSLVSVLECYGMGRDSSPQAFFVA